MASQFAGYRWGGWDLGEKTLYFWGVSGRVSPTRAPFKKRFKKALYQAGMRNVVKTLYQFSEDKLDEYVEFWKRWKPHSVVGYAFGMYCLARHILDHGLTVPGCHGVILAAEATTPEQRTTMAEALRLRGCSTHTVPWR